METAYKYYMVHNPNNRAPSHSHGSRGEAIAEAKRLSNKHPGERFFVLEAVDCYAVLTPQPTRISVEVAPEAE